VVFGVESSISDETSRRGNAVLFFGEDELIFADSARIVNPQRGLVSIEDGLPSLGKGFVGV